MVRVREKRGHCHEGGFVLHTWWKQLSRIVTSGLVLPTLCFPVRLVASPTRLIESEPATEPDRNSKEYSELSAASNLDAGRTGRVNEFRSVSISITDMSQTSGQQTNDQLPENI